MWCEVLSCFRALPVRILEIGSWEGRSALFFLNYLPNASIVCIDTFAGAVEALNDESLAKQIPCIEGRFDRNMAPFGSRVRKIKDRSVCALEWLHVQGEVFDLVYIDGGHSSTEVAGDSVRAWQLVRVGGIVIWDDYEWGLERPVEDRPQAAIDDFLQDHTGQYALLVKGRQVIVRRVSA